MSMIKKEDLEKIKHLIDDEQNEKKRVELFEKYKEVQATIMKVDTKTLITKADVVGDTMVNKKLEQEGFVDSENFNGFLKHLEDIKKQKHLKDEQRFSKSPNPTTRTSNSWNLLKKKTLESKGDFAALKIKKNHAHN